MKAGIDRLVDHGGSGLTTAAVAQRCGISRWWDEGLQIELACEAHWRSVHTREYAANLESTVGARWNEVLAEQFVPIARRHDAI